MPYYSIRCAMHIVFTAQTKMYLNRGDAVHVAELAEHLARLGARVTLIASGRPPRELAGVEVIDAGRVAEGGAMVRAASFPRFLIRLLRHAARAARVADVLYTRHVLLGCVFTLARPLFRRPVVLEANSIQPDEKLMLGRRGGGRLQAQLLKWAERTAARRASAVVCVTEGIRDVLASDYGVASSHLRVVGNGVNLGLFAPNAQPQQQRALRERFALDERDAVIVFLGSLEPWQDIPTLLRAVAKLDLPGRKAVLLIAGDGTRRAEYEEAARKLAQEVRVVFTGQVPYADVPAHISLADVCVMPFTRKRNERIGLSPIKLYAYLACGKYVVGSRIAGLEFLEQEGLGRLVTPEDAGALAQALKACLEASDAREERARRARRYAEEHCGWDRTARAVLDICAQAAES